MKRSGVRSRLGGGSPLGLFCLFFLLFVSVFAIWSLATPLMGLPDEPAHTIRAVAIVRGEVVGTPVAGPSDPHTVVTVPQLYANVGGLPSCFAFKPGVPASCARALTGSAAPTPVVTYVGRYPPLYYALVGLPSLLTVSVAGVRLMRLMSAALSALLLALAATSIAVWSRSRILFAGLVLAATPQLFFLGGGINPSGFEVSAAICLWCSALVLTLEHAEDPPLFLVAVVGFSGSVLVLARALDPLWELLIAATVVALAGRRTIAALLHHRRVQIAAGTIVVCSLLALAWILGEHALDHLATGGFIPTHLSNTSIFLTSLGETGLLVRSAIGEFGWLDTVSPFATYLVWYLGLGLVGGLAALTALRRELAVIVALVVAAVLVPAVIIAEPARRYGFAGQGRDFMALTVGVPIVAAALAARSPIVARHGPRLVLGVGVVTALGQVAAFGEALRRNAIGLEGPLNYFNGSWHPPLGAATLTVLVVLAWIAIPVVLWRLTRAAVLAEPGARDDGGVAGPVEQVGSLA